MRILVPVDGSENAVRAVRHAIDTRDWYRDLPELHLLNVQLPVASGAVKMFFSQQQLNDFYQDEGEKSLERARQMATGSGLKTQAHIAVGDLAPAIVRYARDQHCDLIVMGTRGMGSVASMLLGSVATKVIHLAECPVLLVK